MAGIKDREVNASISITDMPDLDEKLISAEAEAQVSLIQVLITSIRNLRAEINLSPAVKCDVALVYSDKRDKGLIENSESYIKSLAKIENLEMMDASKKPEFHSITSIAGPYQVYLKIEGLVDFEQERARLDKEIERAESFLESINKKLSNENFVSKASPEVVNNEKKKLEDTRLKLEKLRSHYKLLSE